VPEIENPPGSSAQTPLTLLSCSPVSASTIPNPIFPSLLTFENSGSPCRFTPVWYATTVVSQMSVSSWVPFILSGPAASPCQLKVIVSSWYVPSTTWLPNVVLLISTRTVSPLVAGSPDVLTASVAPVMVSVIVSPSAVE